MFACSTTLPLLKEGRCEAIAPFATKGALAPQRSVLQHPANRRMSLATREQKDVTTDFALCRAFGSLRDKGHDRATTKRIKDN